MALFGVHVSIAGGLPRAIAAGQALGCETIQLFTGSPHTWKVAAVTDEAAAAFRAALKASGLKFPMVHDSYLINLAAPETGLYRKSIEAFAGEISRAEALGLTYLVMHPGTPTDGDEAAGLQRIAAALDETHARFPRAKVKVLLETTAGQGASLGHRFEHLASILERVRRPERLGVCLDTCHVFAAGYALAPAADYRKTFREFDKVIGLDRLMAFHVNDSLKPHGSRVDRHAHIGKGAMGLEPFRLLVNDRRFRGLPMVLETPKRDATGADCDPLNLATLRGLAH